MLCLFVVMCIFGYYSWKQLSIEAYPDIADVTSQVVTQVPGLAAEEVEQENCLSSSYVQMNIPYADFYKAAGVDNASEIDAVTSATKNKPRAGKLVAGSYHVNADGTDITGVSFPVKVLTPWALKNAKQVTDADSYDITVTLKGKESTTTYTGADALFENESYAYYKLSETPAYYITAWYNLFHTQIGVGNRLDGGRRRVKKFMEFF